MMDARAALVAWLVIPVAESWSLQVYKRNQQSRIRNTQRLQSTPFEADLYDNPYEDSNNRNPLAAPPYTKLVIGLTKYTHDATICAADKDTGEVLFAVSKERLTRRKHDGGNAAVLVEECLETLDLHLENIDTVVMNNHHNRILPLESNNIEHLEWEAGLRINGGKEDGYTDPENLLTDAKYRLELSHHLAHAYSTATQAPFDAGLVVVMDGMGESFRTMQHAIKTDDTTYISDLNFGLETFHTIPSNLLKAAASNVFDYREAESVYRFTKTSTSIDLYPVFKRFQAERTPPTLYNHGFENMDSVGALYSRVSSHIFGDWNACGKVMGLAPWADYEWKNGQDTMKPLLHKTPIVSGRLYEEGSLKIDRSLIQGIPCTSRDDPDLFRKDGTRRKRYDFDDCLDETETLDKERFPARVALDAIALAHRMQSDCETVLMDFVQHFKQETGESNLCVSGGVALNSVLNGRLARELGFDQTYISPYPGDEGIAVGCCAFGLFGNKRLDTGRQLGVRRSVALWSKPLTPYLGADPIEDSMEEAISKAKPWLEVETIRNEQELIKIVVDEIDSGGVVALYRSRSEMGPRALGHRSILADPRKKGLLSFINEKVKSRETFRPFAPSVLAEEASKWFDLGAQCPADGNASPYMSITAMVRDDKQSLIPAVTHVDGSSRLQTVTKANDRFYHKLIASFFKRTGVPMVLNTSFNALPGEPIVETPQDAIRTFLSSMGAIEMLVMGPFVISRKQPDVRKLLSEVSKEGTLKAEPAFPIRSGRVEFQSSLELDVGPMDEETIESTTRVRMVDRPMHGLGQEWFPLLDELEGDLLSACDGTVSLDDIMAQYTAIPAEDKIAKEDIDGARSLLQNLVHRLVRLFEYTFISW
ncbi:hypothetical protein MPSEU_000841200 [Mayamaea pseudoterrestris]|nr:hypothetical protein MPSEU_000841200 [Mayamaea pseudoterrestris]